MQISQLKHIHTFCHTGDCCPMLLLDEHAPPERELVITDDFGGSITISREDFRTIQAADVEALRA